MVEQKKTEEISKDMLGVTEEQTVTTIQVKILEKWFSKTQML